MNRLQKIYSVLERKFGPQNWWPTTPAGEIYPRYLKKSKLSCAEKWEITIGAILTQNTSWKNVEKAIANLNKTGFFTKLASGRLKVSRIKIKNLSSKVVIGEMIKPSGFYNQKSDYLKNFIDYVRLNYGGDIGALFRKTLKDLRVELLKLKGIGRETADSIVLYAAQKPTFVVDAYTVRIFERLGLLNSDDYENVKEYFENGLNDYYTEDKTRTTVFSQYHALLVVLGKNYCKKNKPVCAECPLLKLCKYGGRVKNEHT